MNALKRMGALIFLLLSATGVILCISGVVAVWVVRRPLTDRIDRTCSRVDTALGQAGDALQVLDQLFVRAGENLKTVRDKEPPPNSDAGKVQDFRQYAARAMVKEMIPGDATPVLQKLIATTTIANSVLGDLQELPTDSLPFLDKDQLSQMDDGVRQLATTTQKVADLLGAPAAGADADVNQEMSRVEEALNRIIALIAKYRDKVEDVRDQAHTIQAKLDSGILWGAVGATVLLAWFTIAQISLFVHAWSWWRGPSAR